MASTCKGFCGAPEGVHPSSEYRLDNEFESRGAINYLVIKTDPRKQNLSIQRFTVQL